jgi:hypothetical protein
MTFFVDRNLCLVVVRGKWLCMPQSRYIGIRPEQDSPSSYIHGFESVPHSHKKYPGSYESLASLGWLARHCVTQRI